MKGFFASLRFRLILLVLLAVAPAIGVILYQAHVQRHDIQQKVTQQALLLAHQVSDSQSAAIRESRPLLATLGQLMAMVDTPLEDIDPAACNRFMVGIRPDDSIYANIGVIAENGNLICSALPFDAPLNLADRGYFQRAIESRDFVIGEFQVGRITGSRTINTAMPVLDSSGGVKGVAFAALDLGYLSNRVGEASLPSGTVIHVLDRHGMVLMRHPEPDDWIGRVFSEAPLVALSLDHPGGGAARAPGLDGTDRLFSFVPLVESLGPDSPVVYVGIPAAVAFAEVDRSLTRNLAIMAVAGLLALGATWTAGELFVLRQVRTLGDTARRLADGDLGARSGLSSGVTEINRLAHAFDEMAAALQDRLAEIQESREQVQELAEEEAAVAEIGRIISSSLDIDRVYDSFAQEVHRIVPWDRIAISLADVEAGTDLSLYYRGVPLADREPGSVGKLSAMLTGQVLDSRAGVLLQNRDAGEVLEQVPGLAQSFQAGLRSFISAPLISNNKVIGALHLASVRPNAYTQRHLNLAERVGYQIAGAIASARLYRLRQQAAEALRAAERDARRRANDLARSNAELEQFAYIASHDLQEPLRSITGFTSLLGRRYRGRLDDDADRFITRITEATARMQRLINDLLTYSRVGRSIKLQPIDCRELLEQEIASMHSIIRDSGAVVTCDDLPTVTSDPTLLAQVLRNLMANAVKFAGAAAPAVHISAQAGEDRWVFAVRDNGIGIDAQYQKRIFTIFERLHSVEEYPGTGIGLSVCKKAVECWGGRIWVESQPGAGSTFFFTVPYAPHTEAESAPDSPADRGTEGEMAALSTSRSIQEEEI